MVTKYAGLPGPAKATIAQLGSVPYAIDKSDIVAIRGSSLYPRVGGDFAGIGLFLLEQYEWRVVIDNEGAQVLLALRK